MTALNKQALREAAENTTAGQWVVELGDEVYAVDGDDSEQIAMVFSDNGRSDAAFIAAASPVAVLSLLDENLQLQRDKDSLEAVAIAMRDDMRDAREKLEAAEKRIAELQSSVIAPGIMRCAGCGFVLTKNNINMAAGTITAGDSNTEPCPNGCGPLWPVTWKEQALQMRDDSEQWFEELQQSRQRIAELEARTVTVQLPADNAAESESPEDDATAWFDEGWNARGKDDKEALIAAGIGVKGE